MRGTETFQDYMFSYVSPEQRVPKDHPLRPIRQMVDRGLKELSKAFDRLYSTEGRPSIAPEKIASGVVVAGAVFDSKRADADGAVGLQLIIPMVCGIEYGRRHLGRDGVL